MESWDDDNFEPPTVIGADPAVATNKWEGEDEDDEVKDNWEDEDEEKRDSQVEVSKSKKKTLAEKIAEKERLQREAAERRKMLEDDELSPEERLQRQKESDLKLALETTFGDSNNSLGELPTTKEEFQDFGDNLTRKLMALSKSVEYPNFAETVIRNMCAPLNSNDIKKIKNTLDNLYLEKQKIEKGDKSKKNKGKGKVKLKMDDSNPLSAYVNDDAVYDDYNDFM